MEKIQHSVSGRRVRSTQHAEKGKEGGVADGALEAGKVARTIAYGEWRWNWMRRTKGRLEGRRGRRWGRMVSKALGWWNVGGRCGGGGIVWRGRFCLAGKGVLFGRPVLSIRLADGNSHTTNESTVY